MMHFMLKPIQSALRVYQIANTVYGTFAIAMGKILLHESVYQNNRARQYQAHITKSSM